jgi:SAM-dependent methyltransferase
MPITAAMTLTSAELDDVARQYYLTDPLEDMRIEEMEGELGLDRIAAAIAGCERVLEMGYGTGMTTRALRGKGIAIEVVEGSPVLVETARREHPELVVHEAMFERFEPGPVYDAVLALFVAEHVDDPVELFRTAAAWLRPGGLLVVAVPNAGSLHRRLAVRMGLQERNDSFSGRDRLLGHQRVYELPRLRADVETAGLGVVEELGWFLKVLPFSMMLGYSDELIRGLHDVSPELPPELLGNIAVVARR